jgi:hypothetical protein
VLEEGEPLAGIAPVDQEANSNAAEEHLVPVGRANHLRRFRSARHADRLLLPIRSETAAQFEGFYPRVNEYTLEQRLVGSDTVGHRSMGEPVCETPGR